MGKRIFKRNHIHKYMKKMREKETISGFVLSITPVPHLFLALFRCVSIFEAKIFTVEFTRGLKDVLEIQSNDRAFAVIMSNGTVASWGIGDAGGDSSEVQDLLKDVRHIQVGCVFFFGCLVVGSFGCGGHK